MGLILLGEEMARTAGSRAGPREAIFAMPQARAPGRWPSVLMSVTLHWATVMAMPPLATLLGPDRDDLEAARLVRLERLRDLLPDRITYQPRPKPLERIPPAPSRAPGVRAASRQGLPGRRIELPRLTEPPTEQQTLLQPDLPERTIANLRLPEFLYWSEAVATPRPVRRFVVPGHERTRPEPVQLAEPPKLAQPGNPSEGLNVPEWKALNATPRLPLPPSLGTPLRAGPATEQLPSPASMDALPGDASAVLSLHPNPLPMGDTIAVPPVNQLGIVPGDGGSASGLAITAQARGSAGGRGTAGAPSVGSSPNAGAGEGGPAAGRGGGGSGAGAATGDGNGNGAGAAPGTPSFAFAASVPIKTLHPDNGVFDIVIMQSSLGADAAESERLLSGRPVYTVYLKPGGSVEWILRYCAAGSAGPARATGVSVQLGNPSPVKAPYTRATVIPSAPLPERQRATMIHGFLTTAGQFRDLRAVRAEDAALVASLEPFLKQWDFRPATRSGAPIEVEVLLVIPPSRNRANLD